MLLIHLVKTLKDFPTLEPELPADLLLNKSAVMLNLMPLYNSLHFLSQMTSF